MRFDTRSMFLNGSMEWSTTNSVVATLQLERMVG